MTTQYGGSGDPARSIELLWGIQPRPTRGPKPRFTVAGITAAAIELADADGLAALSMRRVAERLGTTAMALYSYVPAKAELLDLMVDAVSTEADDPSGSADWRERLEQVARDSWARYRRHPWLLQIAASRPVLGPGVLDQYERELRAVEGLGLTDIEMDLVIQLIADYVHGAVRSAIHIDQSQSATGMTDQQWWEACAPVLEKVYDAERYPIATRVGAAAGEEYQAAVDPARAFEFGLARVLDGIEVLISRRTGE
jgi:AcrR family transcriptional regulator